MCGKGLGIAWSSIGHPRHPVRIRPPGQGLPWHVCVLGLCMMSQKRERDEDGSVEELASPTHKAKGATTSTVPEGSNVPPPNRHTHTPLTPMVGGLWSCGLAVSQLEGRDPWV